MSIARNTKLFLLLSLLFVSLTIFQQSASAVSLTDDFSITKGKKYNANQGSNYILDVNSKELSFLKFDISSLKGKNVDSAKLDIYGLGFGSVSLYYIADDNWVDEDLDKKVKTTNPIINGLLGTKLDTENISFDKLKYSFNFNSLSDLINDIHNGDQYFSLALKADDAKTAAYFASREFTSYNPSLEVATSPVPEPSSMVLGFLGLGSLLGLRRKNQKKVLESI